MHGLISNPRHTRQDRRRHSKRHHAAALRAFTGARLLLGLPVTPATQQRAADMVASTTQYIAAAVTILQAGDQQVVDDVLAGRVPLLVAASEAREFVKILTALRAARPDDLAKAGAAVGVDRVWDRLIAPNVI
jgi:hypothetical protein